jgi:hypothetical protein
MQMQRARARIFVLLGTCQRLRNDGQDAAQSWLVQLRVSVHTWLKALKARPKQAASFVDVETPMLANQGFKFVSIRFENLKPDLCPVANAEGSERENWAGDYRHHPSVAEN